ncbi:SIS domain-containing protein [uncultured Ilyobacter sp.]|uniref:MurR/RpiR family transcriptional regulator n=1 Tax=uncultured Ilyobacter sp. TaxID=544433 RepID=UPI0029C826D2|nr:SIS domain-containing protein [uncultured Ilyobacter sp.]
MEIDVYKLAEKYKLTESEEMALHFILNNVERALEIGVRGVAKECYASSSVVMNLSKKLGYKGFVDMVYRLEQNLFKTENEFLKKNDLCENFSPELISAFLQRLKEQKNKPLFVHGVGFSHIVAQYIKDKLMVEGFFAMMSEYFETVENPAMESPLLIFISKSGETSSLINLCERSKKSNANIISFVGKEDSTIEMLSDITFIIKDSNRYDDRNLKENDFFGNTILFFEFLAGCYLKNSQ